MKRKNEFLNRFGNIPNETGLKNRTRIHQGWWRMNVLNEEPGKHPKDDISNVCNTIYQGYLTMKNFLTDNTIKAVNDTINIRLDDDKGIMERDRLFNNLLSSQPLCFNFFGELMIDLNLGLEILKIWWSDLTKLRNVVFEFAPKENYTNDNSAFDVAFEVSKGNQTGLIGLECKYTDSFSATEYDKLAYKKIYGKSNSFKAIYNDLKSSKYNQLFRNQLIAEALVQNKKYDFVETGLFCYQQDKHAIKTADEFQKMLNNPSHFKIITYKDFIERVQKIDLNWNQREWTMLLWARYCATVLSDTTYNKIYAT
jgi:hypothetical protein